MKALRLVIAILTFGILFTNDLRAAGGGDKGSVMWAAAGGGTTAPQVPKDKVDVDNVYYLMGGFDAKIGGPLFFTIGAAVTESNGKLDYDYLGEDSVQYQVDDLDYSSSSTEYFAGIKLRIINTKYLKFFIGGGGLYGEARFKYDAAANATLVGQGSFYEEEQKGVNYGGYYASSGFDIMFGNQNGIRFGSRFSEGRTDRINALDKKHLRFRDTIGFLAIIKEL